MNGRWEKSTFGWARYGFVKDDFNMSKPLNLSDSKHIWRHYGFIDDDFKSEPLRLRRY